MSRRPVPLVTAASALALVVVAGPAWSDAGGIGLPPKSPQAGQGPQAFVDHSHGPKDQHHGPKGDDDQQQGTDDALDGTYSGEVVHTDADVSSRPTAQPVTAYEMPFPCGEVWTGTTRASHSPSERSVDWNRTDDFGDPVVAAAAGTVTTAVTGRNRPSYGQFVVIDHGNDESTLYAHLDSVSVTVGQTVTAGTQVGTLGETGNAYGAHLHFEERLGSSVVDSWFHGAKYVFGTAQESQNCGAVSIPDVPLAGNVIGDAKAELAVYRRTGTPAFYVRREPRADKVITYGTSSDTPLLGDWDGNGKANPGVRNPDTKSFELKVGKKVTTVKFGGKTDLAIVGDWNGDGTWEVGTRRAASNLFRLRAADGSVTKVRLGDADDLPVTGDWDGDGISDLGVYDSATATFTLRRVDDTGMEWLSQVGVGEAGDLPVTGDWDANGITDLGVWNPTTAAFSLRYAPTPTTSGRKHVRTQRVRYGNGK